MNKKRYSRNLKNRNSKRNRKVAKVRQSRSDLSSPSSSTVKKRIRHVKINRNRIFLMLAVLLVGVSILIYLSGLFKERKVSEDYVARSTSVTADSEESSSDEIRKLLESPSPIRPTTAKNPGSLENLIKSYLRRNGINFSSIGFSYYNFKTDVSLNINADEVFVAASIMKVPINMLTYDLINSGDISTDTVIAYLPGDMEGGTGRLQSVAPGGDYEIREVLKLSITESDNVATNMLYRFLGDVNQEYLLDSLSRIYGIHSNSGNEMTPSDAINILTILYNSGKAGGAYTDLLDDMSHTIYNDYFTRDIKNVKIAHKTGDYDGYFNDIGIIYDEQPFAFAIFTNNVSYPDEVLANLGKIVYDWHISSE